jgi:predicted nucleic acid-binding protein
VTLVDDRNVAALTAAERIVVQPAQDTPAAQLLREELDAGESAAIILAKELGADLVLMDERAATRKARALGLPVIGTLGCCCRACVPHTCPPSDRWWTVCARTTFV